MAAEGWAKNGGIEKRGVGGAPHQRRALHEDSPGENLGIREEPHARAPARGGPGRQLLRARRHRGLGDSPVEALLVLEAVAPHRHLRRQRARGEGWAKSWRALTQSAAMLRLRGDDCAGGRNKTRAAARARLAGLGEGVDDGQADAVQSAGHGVASPRKNGGEKETIRGRSQGSRKEDAQRRW